MKYNIFGSINSDKYTKRILVLERKIEKMIFILEQYFDIKHSYKLLLWYTIDKLSWMSAKSLQLFHFFTSLKWNKNSNCSSGIICSKFLWEFISIFTVCESLD